MRSAGRALFALAAAAIATAAFFHVEATAQERGGGSSARTVWDRLEKFESEAALLRYLRAVGRLPRPRRPDAPAFPPPPPPLVAPDPLPLPVFTDMPAPTASPAPAAPPPPAAVAPAPSPVIVNPQPTASPIPSADAVSGTTITNTQKVGVDEGDIVKQVGRFLIVLQDGRLFTVDTHPDGQPGLRFVDRTDVYRTDRGHTWYDEMLVFENRVVVTGYSYEQAASEIAVFTMRDTGALEHEATYYLSSNDYYSSENYATRLVNDRLILYSPLALWTWNPARPLKWPRLRRWTRESPEGKISEGDPVLGARDIYPPLQRTRIPFLHTLSVCPLGRLGAGDELDCTSTGIIGPPDHELYVSRTHAYLWLAPSYDGRWGGRAAPKRYCEAGGVAAFEDTLESVAFQIALDGGEARAVRLRGEPDNQFSLDTSDDEFRALLIWDSTRCRPSMEDVALKYFRMPLNLFSADPTTASALRYYDAPSPGARNFESRFTDRHVVYGGRSGLGSFAPENSEAAPLSARVVTIPLAAPHAAIVTEAPHNIIRIERAGAANVILTGYRDADGLSLSLLDLRGAPRLAGATVLAGRYESEGRSHAFNSLIGADGAGLLGLPTVKAGRESGRWVFRSQASDVSFLSLSPAGELTSLGLLAHADENTAVHPSYSCDVSCIDWYGNSRPIFTDGRVFALTGTELIEGEIAGGSVREVRRVNLTTPVSQRR